MPVRALFLFDQAAEQTLLHSTDRRLSPIETDDGVFRGHHRPRVTGLRLSFDRRGAFSLNERQVLPPERVPTEPGEVEPKPLGGRADLLPQQVPVVERLPVSLENIAVRLPSERTMLPQQTVETAQRQDSPRVFALRNIRVPAISTLLSLRREERMSRRLERNHGRDFYSERFQQTRQAIDDIRQRGKGREAPDRQPKTARPQPRCLVRDRGEILVAQPASTPGGGSAPRACS